MNDFSKKWFISFLFIATSAFAQTDMGLSFAVDVDHNHYPDWIKVSDPEGVLSTVKISVLKGFKDGDKEEPIDQFSLWRLPAIQFYTDDLNNDGYADIRLVFINDLSDPEGFAFYINDKKGNFTKEYKDHNGNFTTELPDTRLSFAKH
jgi:hypothetical protein